MPLQARETLTADERRNQHLIIGVSTVLLGLCFVSFVLRAMARRLMKIRFGPDDWCMVAVLLACTCMTTSDLVGIRYGSGVHSANLPRADVVHFQINLYVFMILWAVGTTLVKISVLLFYWRIFATRRFRYAVQAIGITILCTGIAIGLVFAFQCDPPSRFWNEAEIAGTCINQLPFYLSGGAINLLEDVAILILPMPMLWALKASASKKIALSFLFALGGFVCITSIFRIIAVRKIIPTDFTFTNVQGGLWSTIEVELGCICANLPHVRPLVMKYFSQGLDSTADSSSNQKSSQGFRSKVRSQGFVLMHDLNNTNRNLYDREQQDDSQSMSTLPEEYEMHDTFGRIKVSTKIAQITEPAERTEGQDSRHASTFGAQVSGPKI